MVLFCADVTTHMQDTNSEYKIFRGRAENQELEDYRLCFEKNGTVRSMENLQWLHNQNPGKANFIYYAYSGEKIAAIYTALPLIFRINGSLSPALQSIDTLTDSNHRGKGLFIKLADQLYRDAEKSEFALIYGFPNDNSAPGFFKKLHWLSFGEAPFLFKPINPFYFIKKVLKHRKHTDFSGSNHVFNVPETHVLDEKFTIHQMAFFESDYDALWQQTSSGMNVCVDRSASYMNWRYVDKPDENYYRFGVYMNKKLTGVIVFSLKNKHDGRIGYIMELIFKPADEQAGKHLLQFSSRLFKKHKTDVVLAWCFSHSFNYSCYKKNGYYKLPEKLRPQKLFVGVRLFSDKINAVAGDFKNWYLSYSDSDTA